MLNFNVLEHSKDTKGLSLKYHRSFLHQSHSSFFTVMNNTIKNVPYTHEDRQWDARFNVQNDEDLEALLFAVKEQEILGKFKYVLVGGLEIGTRPFQDDYQVRHVHVALIYNNRASKSSILKNLKIKTGNGYYLVPRNRDLPYSGWREHHVKEFSKVDPSQPILFESGILPEDIKKKTVKASEEEKKRKIDDILIEMRGMIEEGREKEAFTKFPRNYLMYGERLKAMITQKRDFFKTNGDPHIWIFGHPGSGKTALLNFVYPDYYKKCLTNKFFDLYDPDHHTHVLLEDLDHEAVDRLGLNFLKTICDEAGFAIDQKYKTPQLARTTVLVTSNFTIPDIIPYDQPGVEENKAALLRRFWHVNVYSVLRLLGLKLLPKFERNVLKQQGNTDSSKLFMSWDYVQDMPTGLPLKTPAEYQIMIKDAYYK